MRNKICPPCWCQAPLFFAPVIVKQIKLFKCFEVVKNNLVIGVFFRESGDSNRLIIADGKQNLLLFIVEKYRLLSIACFNFFQVREDKTQCRYYPY